MNVKEVICSEKREEFDHLHAVLLGSAQRFSVFQLIVLVFTAQIFTVSVSALSPMSFLVTAGDIFHLEALINPLRHHTHTNTDSD